jgi:hypothetical protein
MNGDGDCNGTGDDQSINGNGVGAMGPEKWQ